MTRTKAAALLRREYLENRGAFLWTPAVLTGLMVVLLFGSLTLVPSATIHLPTAEGGEISGGTAALFAQLAEAGPKMQKAIVAGLLSAIVMPALFALVFVIFFTLLGSLYEERRDRSILFWKSMPVSDLAEVTSRLAGALLLAPAIFLAVGYLMQLVSWLFLLVMALAAGEGAGAVLLGGWPMLLSWLQLPVLVLAWAAWSLPVWSWVLFCSAYAPRAPFAFAVLPVLGVMVVEAIFFDTDAFATWFGRHLSGLPAIHQMIGGAMGGDIAEGMRMKIDMLVSPDILAPLASFSDPDLWFGLAVSIGLIAGAVWLRRHGN